jgi:hypothetical protein
METTNNRGLSDGVFVLLDETLPVVRVTLTGYYGFTDSEAEAFEDTLCVWFHRVTRRSGVRSLSREDLREQLLFVACKYARAFQIAKLRGGGVDDDNLSRALNRPAEEVAIELLSRVQHGIST